MKSLLTKIFIIIGLTISINAMELLPSKVNLELEKLPIFKNSGVKIEKSYMNDSLYLLKINVRSQKSEIYLTKDKKYLIAGDIINSSTGEKVEIPIDLQALKGKEALTYGEGKDEYILFTDPECPYCKKFESYFTKIKSKVKIKVFFFPLDFHENARDLSIFIISQNSQKDKITAMFNATKDNKEFKNRNISEDILLKSEKILETHIKLAQELNIQGTPALFDSKGNKVSWVKMLQIYGVNVK